MAGPWELYQEQPATEGPWTQFAAEPAPTAATTPQDAPAAAYGAEIEMAPVYDAMGNVTGYEAPAYAAPTITYGEQMGNVGRVVDDGVRLAAKGASFGLADKFAGAMNWLTGGAKSYDEGVTAERQRTQDIQDANPYAAGAAELGGGLLTGSALLKNGITLTGRLGSGMVGRMAGFGADGLGYGAATGAGNTYSDNLSDYAANAGKSGALGATVGVGLPVAGSLISRGVNALRNFGGAPIAGASRTASGLLRGAAQADEAGLRALPAMGDDAMLVDAGPSMLGLGQGVALAPGVGRTSLVDAVRLRDEGTGARLAASLERNFGPAAVPSQVNAEIRASQRALSPAYEEAFKDARRVDTTDLAHELESAIVNERGAAQQAARELRGMLNVHGADELDPSARTLFATRNAMEPMFEGADSNTRRILTRFRNGVTAKLQDSVPNIREIDAQFADLAQQRGALARGQEILETSRANVVRPEELAAELSAMTQGQRGRLQTGARAEIDRLVGTNVNDLNTLERTLATPQDWNYQKLGQVFGDAPRDALATDLATNRTFRDSYQKIAQGTQTAQRSASAKLIDESSQLPTDTTAVGIGLKLANKVATSLAKSSKETVRAELGRILSGQGPEAQRTVSQLLSQARTANERRLIIREAIVNPAYLSGAAPAYGQSGQR